jgi:hypothetical protein
MRGVALAEGLWIGLPLSMCVIALAVLGLSPAFSWIPELLLLGTAAIVPVAAFAFAGARAATRTRRWTDGLLAGAIAGTLSGAAGGLSYALFGKPLLNIAVGLVLGTVGGALVGMAAGLASAGPRR